MQDMNLKTELPALSFDYERLMAWAKGISSQYDGVVVREEDIAGIKSEMAGLNKMKKAVDDARKEAVKLVSAPIRDFEAQINEVCGVFAETYDMLKAQVQAHEDRAREDKRREVEFMIEYLKAEHEVPDIPIEINQSWLNKSKPLKTVKAEIEALILAHVKAEREAAQLEQAKRDRAVAIEEKCAALSSLHGVTVPPSNFLRLQSLDIPLEQVNADIEKAFATKVATQAAAQAPDPTPALHKMSEPTAPAAPAKSEAKVTTVMLEVTYNESNWKAVEDALRNLQSVCTSARIVERRTAA